MEAFLFGKWVIYILLSIGWGGLFIFQLIQYWAFRRQETKRFLHLRQLQQLVELELRRSRILSQSSSKELILPALVQEQLELINLQVEALKKLEIKNQP